MATFDFDGSAGDTLQAAFPGGSVPAGAVVRVKRGTTVTGDTGSIGTNWATPDGGDMTIEPYGLGSAEAKISTRNGFVVTRHDATLRATDVTIEQNIQGTAGVNYDAALVGLKTSPPSGNGSKAARLIALRCRVVNWDCSIKPAGDNSSVSYCVLVNPRKNYVAVSGEATDGGTPQDGYIGYNTCTSTRFSTSAQGDGISVHDGKAGDFNGTGWIVEWNDVDMGLCLENAYDVQEWFAGTIFRFNIARNARQFAFTAGDDGSGTPPTPRTYFYGNVALNCGGGFNIEHHADVYSNRVPDVWLADSGPNGANGIPLRINAAADVLLVGNDLRVAPGTTKTYTSRGIITVANAGATLVMRNNLLMQGGGALPFYHSTSAAFSWAAQAASHNQLVGLADVSKVYRTQNGTTIGAFAAWQALGLDVTGSAALSSHATFLLDANGRPAQASPLRAAGLYVAAAARDVENRARSNPPTIGPYEIVDPRLTVMPRRRC